MRAKDSLYLHGQNRHTKNAHTEHTGMHTGICMLPDWRGAHSHQVGLSGHLRRDLWILAPIQWFLSYRPWFLAAASCARQHTGSSNTEDGKGQCLLGTVCTLSTFGLKVWHGAVCGMICICSNIVDCSNTVVCLQYLLCTPSYACSGRPQYLLWKHCLHKVCSSCNVVISSGLHRQALSFRAEGG